MKNNSCDSFAELSSDDWHNFFENQMMFQKQVLMLKEGEIQSLPKDSVEWFEYHSLAMIEEMGEVLKADKRWKTHRNERYEKEEKLDELADVFITFMNLCIFSGVDANTMSFAISKKIKENFERLNKG